MHDGGKVRWFDFQSDQGCDFSFSFSFPLNTSPPVFFLSFFSPFGSVAFAMLTCEICVLICVELAFASQAVVGRTMDVSGKLRCSWR